MVVNLQDFQKFQEAKLVFNTQITNNLVLNVDLKQ